MDILFIDDEHHFHPVISSLLDNYGERNNEPIKLNGLVDPVQGMFEATNHGHKYDLVLLDLCLPKLMGTEIYQRMIATYPQMEGRTLFVTGFREELDNRFPDHGLNVLEKPFRYGQLEEKIQAIMA